jgi:flavodoxin
MAGNGLASEYAQNTTSTSPVLESGGSTISSTTSENAAVNMAELTGSKEATSEGDDDSPLFVTAQANEKTNIKSLVIYFSRTGNTRAVAEEIQRQTGANVFELVPVKPYPDDYDTVVDIAKQEQKDKARPAYTGTVNLTDYEIIFLGYPNWWHNLPMIVYTFLYGNDLSGKTIAPFVTHGGSKFSRTIATIKKLEPKAKVLKGLSIRDRNSSDPKAAVEKWLQQIGLNK